MIPKQGSFRTNPMPDVEWREEHRDGFVRKHTGQLFEAEAGVRSIIFYIIRRDGKMIRRPASKCRVRTSAILPMPRVVGKW